MKLDILSDPICPWCYIGKAHLDRALASAEGSPFEIEWHPFQLNPDMPPEGMDRQEYLDLKFGGRQQADRINGRIAAAMAEAGIDADLNAILRTPNTLNAHRVIHWAGLEAAQTPVVSAIFDAYFRRGEDIGDDAVLLRIVGECGLESAMFERLLASDADIDDIISRDRHARARGVTGVPTFVVGGRHVVVGAQPPELWGRVLSDLQEHPPSAGFMH